MPISESPKSWYVAKVHTNTEQKTSHILDEMGIENFIAVQPIIKFGRNGRKIKSVKKVIGGIVFVKCTEHQRRREVVNLPTVNRFMMDSCGKTRKVAVVSQQEIDIFRFMIGQSEIPVDFSLTDIAVGKRVKVSRGALKGLEGIVKEIKSDKTEMVVQLESLGCASLSIESCNLDLV